MSTEETKTATIIPLFKKTTKKSAKCDFHGEEVPAGKYIQSGNGKVICFQCVALANQRLMEDENEQK